MNASPSPSPTSSPGAVRATASSGRFERIDDSIDIATGHEEGSRRCRHGSRNGCCRCGNGIIRSAACVYAFFLAIFAARASCVLVYIYIYEMKVNIKKERKGPRWLSVLHDTQRYDIPGDS